MTSAVLRLPPLARSIKECGAPGRTRTSNLLIRSQMLYPLSYGRMPGTGEGGEHVARPWAAGKGSRGAAQPAGMASSMRSAISSGVVAWPKWAR